MINLTRDSKGQTNHCWSLVSVLAMGLYIRLILAFFPGFAADTEHMIKYVSRAQYFGVTSVTDIYDHTLYPPLFVYQAFIASKVVSKLSKQPVPALDSPITAWDRLGVRIIPILSDIVISGLIFMLVAP